jgi:ribosomal protein L29
MVADMISAYHAFRHSHERLYQCGTEEEFRQMATATLENYLENRACWEELYHYREKGKVLGHHPAFEYLEKVKQIRAMSIPDLVRRKIALDNALVRLRKQIRTNSKPHLNQERQARLKEKTQELNEVNKMLNL